MVSHTTSSVRGPLRLQGCDLHVSLSTQPDRAMKGRVQGMVLVRMSSVGWQAL